MEDRRDPHTVRLEKLARLRELGVNPYPYRFRPTHSAERLTAEGDALVAAGTAVALAGRVMARRDMGKAAFAHVKDGAARLQVYVRQDVVGPAAFAVFGLVDLGDYLGLHGTMMRTKTGELTLRVERLELLAKAIRALPAPKVELRDGAQVVHDAVHDVEFRYRQRYADLALNDEVRAVQAHVDPAVAYRHDALGAVLQSRELQFHFHSPLVDRLEEPPANPPIRRSVCSVSSVVKQFSRREHHRFVANGIETPLD